MVPFLNPSNVPPTLRQLIPLAERYGVACDLERERLVAAASPEDIATLKAVILQYDDELDNWLAGPEAVSPPFSEEYIAFSAMRMASDFSKQQ